MKKLLLITTLILSSLCFAQAPTNGLVGYYNFANNLNSSVGSHSFTNGTATNVTYDVGKYGNGVVMGGSSALLNTSMVSAATLSTNVTVAWWEFRPSSVNTAINKFSFALRGGLYYGYVGTSNCGAVYYDRYQMNYNTTTGNFCATLNSHTGGNAGVWTHHAFTKQGTVVKYYMNGVLSWTPNTGLVNDNNPMQTPLANFVFGALCNVDGSVNASTCMTGNLDELYVYDRALTATEIVSVKDYTGVQPPTISNVTTSGIGLNSANINYTLNANSSATSSVINYGTSVGTLSSQVAGNSASGTSNSVSFTSLSGLLSGTTYYYNLVATNANGSTTSATGSFVTDLPTPTISNIDAVNGSINTVNINYILNAKGFATTSLVKYGTSASSLTNTVSGGGASGTNNTTILAALTNLTIGVTYYYQIEATNSFGTTISAIRFFSVADPTTVAEYSFDDTWANLQGNAPFETYGVFTTDRNGNANGALGLFPNGTSALIANLPTGNSARTISIWVKSALTTFNDNQIFNYGGSTTNLACGLTRLNSDNKLYFYGYSNDLSASYTSNGNNWVNYVTTYQPDGTAKIYINGVLFAFAIKPGWNTTNTSFKIGRNVLGTNMSDLLVDDLKIFNRVLTQTEITNLYSFNSTLSSQNFNMKSLKASIYPNPTSNNFTIEMENDVKSIEIYSLQGQKVLTTTNKNVNVSNLSKGIYLIRIEDVDNAVATQKLIVE